MTDAGALAALSHSPAAMALVDEGGLLQWCSAGFAQAVCGRSAEECLGQPIDRLLETPWVGRLIDAATTPLRVDVRGRSWLLRADPAGPACFVLRLEPAADPSDLRQQLAELRERLEIVQHFCHAGFFERDPGTRQGRWDGHMYRIFGLTPPVDPRAAPPYEQIETMLLAEDRMPHGFVTTLDQPGEHAARLRLRRPDGQLRHIHSQWKVMHDDQGRPVRVLGVNIDDTEVFDLLRRADTLKEELDLVSRLGNIGLWRHDLASNRVQFDERACRQLGLGAKARNLSFDEARALIHPDDLPVAQASFDETLRTGVPTDMSVRYRRPGGGWMHMLSRRSLQRDEDGRPVAFVGILLDETDRVARLRAAQELSRRLEAAAEAAGIGLWSTELDGELPRWNRRLFDLFGLPPAEGPLTLGPWLQRCVHPDERDRIATTLLGWARTGTHAIEIEFRALRADDGAVRWLVLRGDFDRRSADGRRRVEGVIIDMTEQRETTRQLHEAAERVALAASAVGLGSWRMEAADAISHWDDGMFRLRGLPPESRAVSFDEMLGYVHPDDRPVARGGQALRGPDGEVWRHNFRVVWPDGSVRWLASRSSPVFDADGHPRGRIGLNWDITESVLAEQAMRERELALADSRAKSRFLSRVSHELRTPLNAVLGFTQLLRDDRRGTDPAVQRQWLDHVDGAGRHLLALIDDVLDLSRLDGGEMSLKLQPVALRDLLIATLPLVEGEARSRSVSLHIEDGPAASVQADPLRLRQVVLNLLSNAIKYNRTGGRVWLRLVDEGLQLRLDVADTGRGIEPADLDAVFEPFHRAGAEGSGIAGTGIGLAIARALVAQMGGRLSVRSEPGQGSVFSVSLPQAQSGATQDGEPPQQALTPPVLPSSPGALSAQTQTLAEPTPPTPASSGAAATPARVLYIEDNPVNALVLQAMLAPQDWVTLELAVDGSSGLQQARAHPPDLLLLDMQLPDMSGLEVLHALQADPATAGLRCVVLSANAMPRDIEAARAAGAVDYWTKPVDLPVLLARLRVLLAPLRPA